jgi:hypothetical protein
MWCRVCLAGCTNCASVAPNTFFMDDEHGRCGTRRHAALPTCIIRRQIDTKALCMLGHLVHCALKRVFLRTGHLHA